MMKVFKTMNPKSIKEIAIALALIRPAAAKNYQKAEFLKIIRLTNIIRMNILYLMMMLLYLFKDY